MLKSLAGNFLATLAHAPAHRRFQLARQDPRRAQEAILLEFLRRNADTEFGRRHRYAAIRSVADFRAAVPVRSYAELAPWLDSARQGRPNVLTREPILGWDSTSGATGPARAIPVTENSQREYREALGAWMFDLFLRRPTLLAGAQYWSHAPSTRELSDLLALRDLRFLSVRNPAALLLLLRGLPAGTTPRDHWPDLALISCWTRGASARFLPALRALFPGVEIQGKGLVAAEATVTIPQLGGAPPAPALASHFLEFVDGRGHAHLAHELTVGERYAVVVTTGAGLARYALGDLVDAVGPNGIEYVGRASEGCNLCGEKLGEIAVGRILEDAAARLGLRGFVMLAPEAGDVPRYALFVESTAATPAAEFVEDRLRALPAYDLCRRIGRLGPVEGVHVVEADARYLRACEALGQTSGRIAHAYLRSEFGWRERLDARHAG